MIVSSPFPAAALSAAKVLVCSRTRRAEPVFKRFNSVAELGHLPKHREQCAKAWLYGDLFLARLVEKLIGHACALSAWGYEVERAEATGRLA